MANYSTDFDFGNAQETGPWLRWHAAPTRDGLHQAGSWSVSDGAIPDLTEGLCLDWPNYRTGWIQSGGQQGVAPQKRWNANRAQFAPRPGDDFARGFWIPVAWLQDGHLVRAVWEQNQAGAYLGFTDVLKMLKPELADNLPKLPLVVFTGHKTCQFGSGSTIEPLFKLLRYVPRPNCLPEDVEQPASQGNSARNAAERRAVSTPNTGPAWDDDEIPF